jgi:3D-(3,5/4)-trihydroxycyclohexane-1,2-dione acylhydrolase (decyclizing)
VDVLRATSTEEFRLALVKARASDRTTLVHVQADPLLPAPSSDAWWDVPMAEVAGLESTRDARAAYEKARQRQQPYL